jgi:preprotein translocase subunit SecE
MTTTTTTPATRVSPVARLRDFLKEVRLEATKVSWPTRNELRDSTIVVIISVLLVSVFVGIIDQVLTVIMGLMFR